MNETSPENETKGDWWLSSGDGSLYGTDLQKETSARIN